MVNFYIFSITSHRNLLEKLKKIRGFPLFLLVCYIFRGSSFSLKKKLKIFSSFSVCYFPYLWYWINLRVFFLFLLFLRRVALYFSFQLNVICVSILHKLIRFENQNSFFSFLISFSDWNRVFLFGHCSAYLW